jgi:type IV pilus assembly protein PilB
MFGESVVIRVLDRTVVPLDLNNVGMPEEMLEEFRKIIAKPNGIILVTGPTGAGKTTTLYSALNELNVVSDKIITTEDPVEYEIDGITQCPINHEIDLTFASALRAILRQDPDIILVGEIRDKETAEIAVQASLTGHLVFSTLHTNDAPSAIIRLTEMGIEPFLVGSSLDCVLAQRLARRLCEWCKEPYAPTDAELDGMKWPTAKLKMPDKLWRPGSCRACGQTGYRGRLAVNEVMPVTEEIERLAVGRASATEVAAVAVAEGMTTLREDGLRKCAAGVTTVEEIFRVTV